MAINPKPKYFIAGNLSANEIENRYGFLNRKYELTGEASRADFIIYDLTNKHYKWPLFLNLPGPKVGVVFAAIGQIDDEHLELLKGCFEDVGREDILLVLPSTPDQILWAISMAVTHKQEKEELNT